MNNGCGFARLRIADNQPLAAAQTNQPVAMDDHDMDTSVGCAETAMKHLTLADPDAGDAAAALKRSIAVVVQAADTIKSINSDGFVCVEVGKERLPLDTLAHWTAGVMPHVVRVFAQKPQFDDFGYMASVGAAVCCLAWATQGPVDDVMVGLVDPVFALLRECPMWCMTIPRNAVDALLDIAVDYPAVVAPHLPAVLAVWEKYVRNMHVASNCMGLLVVGKVNTWHSVVLASTLEVAALTRAPEVYLGGGRFDASLRGYMDSKHSANNDKDRLYFADGLVKYLKRVCAQWEVFFADPVAQLEVARCIREMARWRLNQDAIVHLLLVMLRSKDTASNIAAVNECLMCALWVIEYMDDSFEGAMDMTVLLAAEVPLWMSVNPTTWCTHTVAMSLLLIVHLALLRFTSRNHRGVLNKPVILQLIECVMRACLEDAKVQSFGLECLKEALPLE
jgi:hypothetical protein